MKFNWDKPIAGTKYPVGTNSNCSGGITPWGTILTCEENYDMFLENIIPPIPSEIIMPLGGFFVYPQKLNFYDLKPLIFSRNKG